MEWRELGVTGINVPVVGLGARRPFDVYGKEGQTARRSLVDLALREGVTFFETSPVFGESERILGSSLTGRRKRVIVATNVTAGDVHLVHDQIDRSLRLFEDRIDVFLAESLPVWTEFQPVFQRMKSDRSLSVSGVTCERESDYPELARLMRERAVDVIQVPYNPIEEEAARVILPLAAELGIGVIVMRPFLEGELLLAQPRDVDLRRLRRFGVRSWPQAVLKWTLSDPRVSVAAPATRKAQHLSENAACGVAPWLGRAERALVTELAIAVGR
ncbi:MAG: aldo/keto reductase [Chloroflexia bacterium]|nr:aldo/keto reductase [Chloroflexia bacterium]